MIVFLQSDAISHYVCREFLSIAQRPMNTENHPVRIFIAYAHEDHHAREKLRRQLSVLERRGHFHIFWDGLIKPGERWDERLKDELHQADIFLLLVSECFLDSDYVHEVELPKALALRNEGKAEVFPIILRDCLWRYTELTEFQCVLYDSKPIEENNGYAYVAQLVAETAKQITTRRAEEAQEKQMATVRAQEEKEAARRRDDKAQMAREKNLRDQSDHDTWEFAEEADTEAAYRRYLNKYPEGLHIAQAQAKLKGFAEKREQVEAERKKREAEAAAHRADPFADLMIPIKRGSFDMGDTFNEGQSWERPIHRVTVKDFHLCKYLVTQAQWQAIMGDNPSYFKGDENLPVEQVSWDDVQAFIKKLNDKTGKKYRLPSEAEWEYAARATPLPSGGGVGGGASRFGNGKDRADPKKINFDGRKENKKDYSEVGEYRAKTTIVNTFAPNALGLYDMSGNVWEWCQDVWHDSYKSAPDDGSPWEQGGDSSLRVVRGGSWFYYPNFCRAAYRNRNLTDNRNFDIGFRLAR